MLNQLDDFYKAVVEHSPYTIIILDLKGNLIYANPIFYKFTGINKNDLQHHSIFERIHKDDLETVYEYLSRTKRGEKIINAEYRYRNKANRYVHLSTDAIPLKNKLGSVIAILAMTQDLTNLKKREKKILESQELYKSIFTMSPNAMYVHSKGVLVFSNPQGLELIGASQFEEISNTPIIKYVHPDYREIVDQRIRTLEVDRLPIPPLQEKFIRLDGSIVDVEVVGKPIQYKGNPANLLIVRDLTDQIAHEQEIISSERKRRILISRIPDLLFILDKDGIIKDYSAPEQAQIYFSTDNLIGSNVDTIFSKKSTKQILECISTTLKTMMETSLEYKLHLKTRVIIYEARFTYFDEDEVLVIARDVTRKKTEEKYQLRALRIESLGILAGGIAHDINNILMQILGNTNLIQLEEGLSPSIQNNLKLIERAVNRASKLSKEFLTFSTGRDLSIKSELIVNIIEESASFITSRSKSQIKILYSRNLEHITVDVDANQIEEVLTNLLINAEQSMSEGGLIEIIVDVVHILENEFPELHKNDYVKISIKDQGIGIRDDVMDRIFEPYFTTKPEGTGLGLPTSFSIIKHHKGYIDVRSKPGKGSTFTVYLPLRSKVPEIN